MPATKRQTITADQVFERVIDTVETTQSRMIDVNRTVAENLIGLLPTDRFPSDRLPTVPGLDALPTPTELVDSYFSFADKLNEANHSFSRQLVEAWNVEDSPAEAAKAPAKSTAKKAKSPAKNTTKSTAKSTAKKATKKAAAK